MRSAVAIARVLSLVLALILTSVVPATAAGPRAEQTGFFVLSPAGQDVGPSIARAPRADHRGEVRRERPLLLPNATGGAPTRPGGGGAADGALQTLATSPLGTTNGLSFDGVGVGITPTYADCCAPPDTNASVGATQVVQWVNLDFAVFDKATGSLVSGPTPGNSIWAGFTAGNCGANNDGDPVVKFDAQAGRWLMSQLSVTGGPPFFQCIAVSNTADFVTTTWNRYAFNFGQNFPDYPKVGVWPDAYYMSFNLFFNGVTFNGAAACAFDRTKMLAGAAATGQCFNVGNGFPSLLPSDLDGATAAGGSTAAPPAGSPSFFANFGTNALNLWRFHVDFANSANTTLTGPSSLAVPAFSPACGGGTCVQQAGTTNQLDSLADRLMYRLAYRNFSDHEALVVTHSVKGSGTSAPRWYELRSPGNGTFGVYQASSYAPDTTFRWMGSAAMDELGNLAVGYSASSSQVHPGIRYSGRAAGDPLNQLRQEAVILDGTGSQTGNLHRWGDYSSMALDPADDCTFWYTTGYLKTDGSFNWSTRIASFKFANCSAGPPPTVSGVSPISGPSAGGTAITITGTNFAAGAAVTVGGTAAAGVSVVSATQITATTPAHAAGAADVIVTVGGQSSATNPSDVFTYVAAAPPTVSSVSPTSGPSTGGASVTITGANFQSGATVSFGGSALTSVAVVNATTITGTTPSHAAGAVDVVVSNPDAQSGTCPGCYTYVSSAPVISNVQATPGRRSAVITWTTDIPADSQVEYGTTTAYGLLSALDSTLVTSHSVTLTGLSRFTTYHYRVDSRNSAGQLASSGDFTFTTQ